MKNLFLLLSFFLYSHFGITQSKLTKGQFVDSIKTHIGIYFPDDLKKYTLIFEDMEITELCDQLKKANFKNYIRNDIDTASLDSGPCDYERNGKKNQKKWQSKNYETIHLSRKEIEKFDSSQYPYVIKHVVISSKQTPEQFAYILTVDFYIHDRRNGFNYLWLSHDRVNILDILSKKSKLLE